MKYDEYVRIQTEVHGRIKKPWKYRQGERRAIDWFFANVHKRKKILDVGCGVGTGLRHLKSLGYNNAQGIDLNSRKVRFGNLRYDVQMWSGDVLSTQFMSMTLAQNRKFDLFWMSHSFEHMLYPEKVIQRLLELSSSDDTLFFFVLPYPDNGINEDVHVASNKIGLREDDNGATLRDWLLAQGLKVYLYKFDDYREPEIWMRAMKI